MKQFRLLGMGLLALAISIGFVACSSDDDSKGSSGNKPKKLVQITSSVEGKENVYLFSYDSNGKLKLYNDGYDRTSIYKISIIASRKNVSERIFQLIERMAQ